MKTTLRRLRSVALQRFASVALIASMLLAATTLVVILAAPGDASSAATAMTGLGLMAFILGMFGLRSRVTERGMTALLVTSVVAIAATIIGTAVRISGVALGLPVAVVAVVVIARSRWRLGDAGILTLVVGLGAGIGYVLAAALDPNTGSYGDQGAIVLVTLGIALSSAAVALLRVLPRGVRLLLGAACVLATISFVGLLGALGGAAPLVLGLGAAVLGGGGWIYVGIDLWRTDPIRRRL